MSEELHKHLTRRRGPRLFGDLVWAFRLFRIRRLRRAIGFAERIRFDAALRPPLAHGVIGYPDAVYHIRRDDIERAIRIAALPPPPNGDVRG